MGTYVVTGSASGIGAATTQRLRSRGDRVVCVDRTDADVVTDLGDPGQRRQAVDEVSAVVGDALDGVVCCAGIPGSADRRGDDLVSVNYFGTTRLLEGLRPLMARSGTAAAVCVSSNSVTCQPGWPTEIAEACLAGDETAARARAAGVEALHVYPATKAALAWWARQCAVSHEWAGAGIRLNVVAPGLVETPMTEEMRRTPGMDEILDAYPLPAGRRGRPDEVAAAIEFLLSPAAALCCGSVLFVDGGTDALFNPRRPEPMA
jgi:NAD(P)-dependent dehydrogenase (short-subunit alcohol dehydrogenase family)